MLASDTTGVRRPAVDDSTSSWLMCHVRHDARIGPDVVTRGDVTEIEVSRDIGNGATMGIRSAEPKRHPVSRQRSLAVVACL